MFARPSWASFLDLRDPCRVLHKSSRAQAKGTDTPVSRVSRQDARTQAGVSEQDSWLGVILHLLEVDCTSWEAGLPGRRGRSQREPGHNRITSSAGTVSGLAFPHTQNGANVSDRP